jgi:Transposase DDE domain
LLFSEARPPDLVTVEKGHGRLERREVRVSDELVELTAFPGLQPVAEIRKRVVRLATGEVTEQTRYLVTSLGPEQARPAAVLALFRGHWGIENRLFWVKDDGFGEDRHVLQRHRRGEVVGLLRSTACNLLRGRCALWPATAPLTARAEWVAGHPAAILARL